LSNIDEVVARMENKILGIDDEIRAVVRGQTCIGRVNLAIQLFEEIALS
jgi:hypothetical protein